MKTKVKPQSIQIKLTFNQVNKDQIQYLLDAIDLDPNQMNKQINLKLTNQLPENLDCQKVICDQFRFPYYESSGRRQWLLKRGLTSFSELDTDDAFSEWKRQFNQFESIVNLQIHDLIMSQQNSPFRLISSQSNLSLKNPFWSDRFQPNQEQIKEKNYQIIYIEKQNLKIQNSKIQWRTKTLFPVVKVLNYKVVAQNHSSISKTSKIPLLITLQPVRLVLTDLEQIQMNRALYLLKETLVGAERISDQYGHFVVKESMIAINQNNKCRVWLNSKFHLNQAQCPCKTEQQAVSSVVRLFITKTKKSPKSIKLYQSLQTCKTFCACLQVIKKFTLQNQTSIPSSFAVPNTVPSLLSSPRQHSFKVNTPFESPKSTSEISRKNQKQLPFRQIGHIEKQQCNKVEINDSKFESLSTKGKQKNPQVLKIFQHQKSLREFPVYLKKRKDKLISHSKSMAVIKQSTKIEQLQEVHSIHEDEDSDLDETNAVVQRPKISNNGFFVPQPDKGSPIQQELYLSSLLIDQKSQNRDFDDIVDFFDKNLDSTLDNTVLLKRKDESNGLVNPSIQEIDKSYENEFCHLNQN